MAWYPGIDVRVNRSNWQIVSIGIPKRCALDERPLLCAGALGLVSGTVRAADECTAAVRAVESQVVSAMQAGRNRAHLELVAVR